jgi:predicted amidophosphoribosyltransferase
MVGFCSRCGAAVEDIDGNCACCGAETVDVNLVTVLKRTSSRRSRRGSESDGTDEMMFPL